MSLTELAKDFVDLCRHNENLEAIRRYYSDDIVSVESAGSPEAPAEMNGIDPVRKKNQWWVDNHEIHSAEINGPFIGDNRFAVEFIYDFTHKPSGKRMKMGEMALYTVRDGKVVREHFYYNPGA
jgi:ketosteroid isomerase-like protein